MPQQPALRSTTVASGNARRAAPSPARAVPSLSGDSGRAAGCSAGPWRSGSASGHVREQFLEQHRRARRPAAPAAASSPRSSDGASSRTADRQLGSKKTRRCPRSAIGKSALVFRTASCRASASRPCEISGRPQQTFGASAGAKPAFCEHVARQPCRRRDCSSS